MTPSKLPIDTAVGFLWKMAKQNLYLYAEEKKKNQPQAFGEHQMYVFTFKYSAVH